MTPRRISPLRAIRLGFGAAAFAALLTAFPGCSSLNSVKNNNNGKRPIVQLVPQTVAFGSQPKGTTSSTMVATLTNTGTASLTFTSNPSISGANAADFAIASLTCSTATPVAVGQNCTVTMTFKPSTSAAENALLTFADNASPTTQSVSLTGTGTAAAPVVTLAPSTVAFGPVPIGTTSSSMTVTLTNTGSASLTFSSNPFISGTNAADFSIVSPTTCSTAASVAAGTSCTVNVAFKPSTSNFETAFLSFLDNAANAPQAASLNGGVSAPVANVVPVTVDTGPAGNALNILYVSVTICVPGTTTCQTIDHVQVDTGSSGLRLLASQVTIPVPQAKDAGGNPLANCAMFADGSFTWGPVATADIKMAGEVASSQAIQLINSPGFVTVPTACSNGSVLQITNQATLGANGLLGVGLFRQDCGQTCANGPAPPVYFSCPLNNCSITLLPLLSQLQNPVWMFPQDNNGVLISLPSVPVTGSATIIGCATPPVPPCGSMIFGIGTQPNNALGSATVFVTDPRGVLVTNFNGKPSVGFLDSGSNGFFFLDTMTTTLPACTVILGFYCPVATANITVSAFGVTGTSANIMFTISNAESLHNANPTFAAFSNVGGPFPFTFDFGSPFFYGRTVFTGIEGQSVGGFVGPLFAF